MKKVKSMSEFITISEEHTIEKPKDLRFLEYCFDCKEFYDFGSMQEWDRNESRCLAFWLVNNQKINRVKRGDHESHLITKAFISMQTDHSSHIFSDTKGARYG